MDNVKFLKERKMSVMWKGMKTEITIGKEKQSISAHLPTANYVRGRNQVIQKRYTEVARLPGQNNKLINLVTSLSSHQARLNTGPKKKRARKDKEADTALCFPAISHRVSQFFSWCMLKGASKLKGCSNLCWLQGPQEVSSTSSGLLVSKLLAPNLLQQQG